MLVRYAFALTAAAAAFPPAARASDQIFTHTDLSEINPVGSFELVGGRADKETEKNVFKLIAGLSF